MQQEKLSQDLASLRIDREPAGGRERPPSQRSRWIVIALVLAALGGIAYFVVYPRVTSALYTKEVKTGEILMVSQAQAGAQVQLTATGYVVALVYAKVAAKVPGRIAEIFVTEGQTIEKGAKVARLEDVDFKSARAASRARGAAARARAQIARANLAELRVQIDRETPLVAKGVSARAGLEDLQAHAASLQASVQAADAETAAAAAETTSLEVQLGSYEIVTPIAGTVVQKLVEVGEGVSPGFGTPGVIEVVDLTSLVVEVDVPENRLAQVSVEAPCEIVLDAYPRRSFGASVKEIGRRVNRAKATVPVKVRFLELPSATTGSGDAKITILPEMAARVSFLSKALDPKLRELPPKLVVPTAAIAQRSGGDVVFVIDEGEVRMTPVKVGAPFGDGRELETKIPSGTKVVLNPSANLADGEKVKETKR